MTDPKNFGYIVEQLFYDNISKLGIFIDIKHEKELIKTYGFSYSSIDYILILKDGIIPVQIKYRGSRRRETIGVDNFISSISKLGDIFNKPIIYGLWISRLRPFDDNESLLGLHNIRCVDDFHDMNRLIEKSVDYIVHNLG